MNDACPPTIDPDEQIIQTFEWAGAPNQVLRALATLLAGVPTP